MITTLTRLFAAPQTTRTPVRAARLGLESLDGRLLPSATLVAPSIGLTTATVATPTPVTVPTTPRPGPAQPAPTTVNVGHTAGAATLQQAIDLVADGGTVYLDARTYTENVRVAGKTVHLVGFAHGTVVRAADPALPVITFDLAGGSVSLVELQKGVSGVHGYRSGGLVVLDQVSMGRGVLSADGWMFTNPDAPKVGVQGLFARLEVRGCTFRGMSGHGLSVRTAGDLLVADSDVNSCGNTGVMVTNDLAGGSITVRGCSIGTNGVNGPDAGAQPRGGIRVVGGAKPVVIEDCDLDHNRASGIFLDGVADAAVRRTTIGHVVYPGFPAANGERWESAFLVALGCARVRVSDVTIANDLFDGTYTTGIAALSYSDAAPCRVEVARVTMHLGNSFPATVEKPPFFLTMGSSQVVATGQLFLYGRNDTQYYGLGV